jgi:hypothetical protein
MTAMLYSLETTRYIEERFLSLWSTDWNSSFKWVNDLLSEEGKICINSCHWMSRAVQHCCHTAFEHCRSWETLLSCCLNQNQPQS